MRARPRCGLAAVAVLAAFPACEIVRPLDPHPDVVALTVLLVAGENEARMLAIHPHREEGFAAPVVTAELAGPGWSVGFGKRLPLEVCTAAVGWPGPTGCMAADLPEPIRAGAQYRIAGRAPLGSFTGVMTVPAAPLLLEPPPDLTMRARDLSVPVDIPVLFDTGSDIGTLLAQVSDVAEYDGRWVGVSDTLLGTFPQLLENTRRDTVTVLPRGRPLRFTVQLLGIGRNYTNFLAKAGLDPVLPPWPSFGLEGEGVYGYFDGMTSSRASRIWIRVTRSRVTEDETG